MEESKSSDKGWYAGYWASRLKALRSMQEGPLQLKEDVIVVIEDDRRALFYTRNGASIPGFLSKEAFLQIFEKKPDESIAAGVKRRRLSMTGS